LIQAKRGLLHELYRCEADELWSFVHNKDNKQRVWLVMNTVNRQIIGFHISGRGVADTKILFDKVSAIFCEKATFFTNFWQN
jgi:IS1 family transposase